MEDQKVLLTETTASNMAHKGFLNILGAYHGGKSIHLLAQTSTAGKSNSVDLANAKCPLLRKIP